MIYLKQCVQSYVKEKYLGVVWDTELFKKARERAKNVTTEFPFTFDEHTRPFGVVVVAIVPLCNFMHHLAIEVVASEEPLYRFLLDGSLVCASADPSIVTRSIIGKILHHASAEDLMYMVKGL